VFFGLLGVAAALIGTAFLDFQRAGWLILGILYVLLGIAYVTGRADFLMRSLRTRLGRLAGVRGAIGLGLLFSFNIPVCAVPLLVALLGAAALGDVSGAPRIAQGFVSLSFFGLALSAPLMVAIAWRGGRRFLDRISALTTRAPTWIGLLLIILGLWSIYFGVTAPTPA
jgi:cytochrome c-type biogenesis protein